MQRGDSEDSASTRYRAAHEELRRRDLVSLKGRYDVTLARLLLRLLAPALLAGVIGYFLLGGWSMGLVLGAAATVPELALWFWASKTRKALQS